MIALVLAFIVLLADQILKLALPPIVPQFIYYNHDVAFGFGNAWLVLVGFVLLVILHYTRAFHSSTSWFILLGAATTNMIDRLRVGAVIDYLHIGNLHFNLADIIICLVIIRLIIGLYRKTNKETTLR